MNNQKIIDISLAIQPGMAVYPNNPEVIFDRMKDNTLTAISWGSHTGTHIDAPVHVGVGTRGTDVYSLERFIGPVWVQEISDDESVTIPELEQIDFKQYPRVLFKTKNSKRGFEEFYDNYVYVDGYCADYLANIEGLELVGIDAWSIKQRGSDDHRPHTSLLDAGIVILESIDLSEVKQGAYQLVALPIKYKDLDGAPVRAVLIKE